jgi:hypothetical protein
MHIKKERKEKGRALKPEINLNNIWKLGSHIRENTLNLNNVLILFGEIIAVYSVNHMKILYTLCGKMHEFFILMHIVL